MHIFRAGAGSPLLALPKLWVKLGFFKTWKALKGFLGAPKTPLATARFFTAAPQAFGRARGELRLVPEAPDERATRRSTPTSSASTSSSCEKAGLIAWSFEAQLFIDEATTPIEDASVPWPEEQAAVAQARAPRAAAPGRDEPGRRGGPAARRKPVVRPVAQRRRDASRRRGDARARRGLSRERLRAEGGARADERDAAGIATR